MKLSKIFREAREYLNDGSTLDWKHTRYICLAIKRVNASPKDKELARRIIMQSLDGCVTLSDWLRMKKIPKKQLTHKRVQQHRHEWLKRLEKEFK